LLVIENINKNSLIKEIKEIGKREKKGKSKKYDETIIKNIVSDYDNQSEIDVKSLFQAATSMTT
jgi:hypothetical protein